MSIGTDNPSLPVVSPGEDNENNNNNNKGKYAKRHTKNYYRILYELKKIAPLFKLQKKLKNIKNRYCQIHEEENESSSIFSDSDPENLPYSTKQIIEIFSKHPDNRTFQDLSILSSYLTRTKFATQFLKSNLFKESYEKMIIFCTAEMKLLRFPKDQILFKIGDIPDYFYFIFSGSVDILKPAPYFEFFSGYQYFLHLMKLMREGEKYIYTEIIKENIAIFPIDKCDINILNFIFFAMMLHLLFNGFVVKFGELLTLCNIKAEDLGLDPNEIGNIPYVVKNKEKIYESIPEISNEQLTKYVFLQNRSEKKKVTLFQYERFLTLEKESHFGDMALDANTTRNATVKANEDCIFLYIDAVLYGENLAKGKKMIALKEINFIYQNYFFDDIGINTFEKKYFNFFIIENRVKGDIVCVENKECNFVYFIRKGDVCLYSQKSALEIHLLMQRIENVLSLHQDKKYSSMKTSIFDLEKDLTKKKEKKVFLLSGGEVIGVESFFFNFPYLVTAIVESERATIIKISNNNLQKILSDEKKCENKAKISINNKMKILYDRFFTINNTNICAADERNYYNQNIGFQSVKNKVEEVKNDLSRRNYNNELSNGKKRYERNNSALLNSKVTQKYENKIILPVIKHRNSKVLNQSSERKNSGVPQKKSYFEQFEENFLKLHRQPRKESINYINQGSKSISLESQMINKLKEGLLQFTKKKKSLQTEDANIKATHLPTNRVNSSSSNINKVDDEYANLRNNVNFSLITQIKQKTECQKRNKSVEINTNKKGPFIHPGTLEKLKKYEIFEHSKNGYQNKSNSSINEDEQKKSKPIDYLPKYVSSNMERRKRFIKITQIKKGNYQKFKNKMKLLLSWKFYEES